MGIFDIFKRKLRFQDDLFGELRYTTFKDSSKNFYDGSALFQGQEIGISVDADENGPTNLQKDFFKNLDNNYEEIKNKIIIPFLRKELAENIENSGIDNFDKEFSFDGIHLGKFKDDKTEWSITYDSNPMSHYVSIDFEGMTPRYMAIDG
ncbi:MAG: hypothetical protein ABFS12_17050 [Bacteroidota bacterium]